MYLEDEQYELLGKFVEAHLGTPRERRGAFTAILPRGQWQATFFHSGDQSLSFQGSKSDAEMLANAGLLLKSTGSGGSDTFSVLPEGIEAYRTHGGKNRRQAMTSEEQEWDVFISHAWEDKSFVRPLAEALRAEGFSVWFDEFTLKVGDSLRRSIDAGLARARKGIVVLSPAFFRKEWPQKELDALVTRESSSGSLLLPIWHNISAEEIARFSPLLADRVATTTSHGLDRVVQDLLRAMRQAEPAATSPSRWDVLRFIALAGPQGVYVSQIAAQFLCVVEEIEPILSSLREKHLIGIDLLQHGDKCRASTLGIEELAKRRT